MMRKLVAKWALPQRDSNPFDSLDIYDNNACGKSNALHIIRPTKLY